MNNSSKSQLASNKTKKLLISNFLNSQPLEKVFRMPNDGEVIASEQGYYRLGNVLGSGYFGTTFECLDEWGNHLVAKVIVPRNHTYEDIKYEWGREFTKLIQLRHPHITFIYDAFEHNDTFYLIIERCIATLDTVIQTVGKRPDLGDLLLPYIARDVLQAVKFIHLNGYVHKDIHPGNVFISEVQRSCIDNELPFSFVVGDLGISNLEKNLNISNTVFADWMHPPESLNPVFGRIGKSVDIYHTGLLLLNVLCGKVLQFSKTFFKESLGKLQNHFHHLMVVL